MKHEIPRIGRLVMNQSSVLFSFALRLSISQITPKHRDSVNIMLFQFGSKKVLETNISNGTSEISPKIKRPARYFLRFRVLKKPSIRKNMKIGKAILPIIENAFDRYSSVPLPFSIGVISALFVWSMSIEIIAMYFSCAPFRIWYGLGCFWLGAVGLVLGAACCDEVVLVFVVAFGGMMDPLVINFVYLFVGV